MRRKNDLDYPRPEDSRTHSLVSIVLSLKSDSNSYVPKSQEDSLAK